MLFLESAMRFVSPPLRDLLRLALSLALLAGLAGCTVVSLESPNWPPAQPGAGATPAVRAPLPPAPRATTEPWVGHYEGTLPCANCTGVRVLLTLNQDSSYVLSLSYLGSNALPHIMRGQFTWNADETRIELDDKGERRRYAVGNREVRLLNRDGSDMLGVLGTPQVLKKRPS